MKQDQSSVLSYSKKTSSYHYFHIPMSLYLKMSDMFRSTVYQ